MKKPTLTPVPSGNGEGISTSEEQKFYEGITVDVLARTIWGEARGEGTSGMSAVACVILNRLKISKARGGFWWGDDIIRICQKPQQFSCWNRADPNFRKLQAVDERDLYFATAVRIARRGVADVLPDVTKGATHYHADSITPYWAKGERPSAVIGHHLFYKII
jgi:N-acetylmuramoyl-L-alanine amidase